MPSDFTKAQPVQVGGNGGPLGLLLPQLHNKTGHLPGKRFIVFIPDPLPPHSTQGQHKAVLRHLLNLGALAKPRNIPIGTLHSLPSSPFGGHP